jgi:hypothetical protein
VRNAYPNIALTVDANSANFRLDLPATFVDIMGAAKRSCNTLLVRRRQIMPSLIGTNGQWAICRSPQRLFHLHSVGEGGVLRNES